MGARRGCTDLQAGRRHGSSNCKVRGKADQRRCFGTCVLWLQQSCRPPTSIQTSQRSIGSQGEGRAQTPEQDTTIKSARLQASTSSRARVAKPTCATTQIGQGNGLELRDPGGATDQRQPCRPFTPPSTARKTPPQRRARQGVRGKRLGASALQKRTLVVLPAPAPQRWTSCSAVSTFCPGLARHCCIHQSGGFQVLERLRTTPRCSPSCKGASQGNP